MYSKKFEEYDKQCCYYLSDFEEWSSCKMPRVSINLSRSMGRYTISTASLFRSALLIGAFTILNCCEKVFMSLEGVKSKSSF